jgi:hypothetical protein
MYALVVSHYPRYKYEFGEVCAYFTDVTRLQISRSLSFVFIDVTRLQKDDYSPVTCELMETSGYKNIYT